MNLNSAIGGYFELELNDFGSVYHDDLLALNSGRNSFEYILLNRNYTKVYVPYYTCDVILQPLIRQNIPFEFYFIDENFKPVDIKLNDHEAILYNNYFGIMNKQVENTIKEYSNVIIDNSQAFFDKPINEADTFYSPRKFFGLPDGGFAFCKEAHVEISDVDTSFDRMSHLLLRIDFEAEEGYEDFKNNDKKLDFIPIKKMSRLTTKLLMNVKFEDIKEKRKNNFRILHNILKEQNELSEFIESCNWTAPLIYPFLKDGNEILRKELFKNRIYPAIYWPNVKEWIEKKNTWESYLQDNLIAIPIDQRYNAIYIKDLIRLF
jgi:hypothetical protein